MSEIASLQEAQQRVILWTMALEQNFFFESDIWRKIPGYRFATCGFADPEIEGDAFGIFVYAEQDTAFKEKPGLISELKVDKHTFPVFLRYATEVFHGRPNVHPVNGTATCWARTNKPGINGKIGFLTAKHVLSAQGTSVLTDKGPVLY